MPDAEPLNTPTPPVQPPEPVRHATATRSDIVLSLLLPPLGIVFGIVALVRQESRRALFTILLSVASVIVMWAALYSVGIKDRYARHIALAVAAWQVNNAAPLYVTRSIRLDGAERGPGLTFTYFYSLLDTSDSTSNQTELAPAFIERMRTGVCASGQYREWLASEITVRYAYRDGAGQNIGSMDFTPANCPPPKDAAPPANPPANPSANPPARSNSGSRAVTGPSAA